MKPSSRVLVLAAFLLTSASAGAESQASAELKNVMSIYAKGKYQTTVDELDALKARTSDPKTLGLISYWKGLSYNRLQQFAEAIESFREARSLKYEAQDFNYEYGQALFAADKLHEARIQFNESFKKGYKRGASLYYMAFIAKDLEEGDNAISLFNSVKKLPPDEVKEVGQPAQMQIADMELAKAEKKSHAVQEVEASVIPAYEEALAMDPESALAPKIKEKIQNLQKNYQLVLFQLRNGRPTVLPRHFLRIAQEGGFDTNVVYAPTETTITKSKQASTFTKSELMGRYTFYHKDFLGVAPELRTVYTRYYNRNVSIMKNDNALIAPAVRTTFEHKAWDKPATALVDYEFNEIKRDIDAKDRLDFAGRAHSFILGERFNFFAVGQSSVKLKQRHFTSYQDASNSKTTSLILEQIVSLKTGLLSIYSSLDRTRVNNDLFDTDALTLRGDWILPAYKTLNPSLGLGLTFTDPVNNRQTRGFEKLINPTFRLSRRFGKSWGTTFRFEYYNNASKDTANFRYKKQLYGLEVDYLF